MKKKKQIGHKKQGFSLIEILLSLLVLGSSLTLIFSGFEVSTAINNHAIFESEAAFLAEREMELAKSELLRGSLKATKPRQLKCRFRLKPEWKLITVLTPPDLDNAVRLQVRVNHRDRELQLESYLFLPEGVVENES